MKSTLSNWLITLVLFLAIQSLGKAQISGFIKTGINFGFINKEKWHRPDYPEDFDYGQPLIRPTLACGLEHRNKKINIRFSLMYQTKGQGSSVPKVRNFYQSISLDAIHFMSFPLSLEYKLWPKFSLGAAIQPSLFLGGTDNYYASEYWKGWIWGAVFNINYLLSNEFELGIEYEHDFTEYYCPGCDERFYTFRFYGAYHFLENEETKK